MKHRMPPRRPITLVVLVGLLTLLGADMPLAARPQPAVKQPADQPPPADVSYEVAFRSRSFTPKPGLQLDAIRSQRAGSAGDDVHFLVQFVRIPSADERVAFAGQGLAVLSYVSGTTYVGSMPLARLGNLDGFNGIRSALPLQPGDKLQPAIAGGRVPPYAQQGRTKALFDVQFHPDIGLDVATDIIRAAGGRVLTRLETINALVVLLDVSRVAELAARDEVGYVGAGNPPLGPAVSRAKAEANATVLAQAPYNLTGAGVTAMVFDSGTADHADINGRIIQRDDAAVDDHATHVAGIIATSGASVSGTWTGVAPQVSIRSFGEDGSAVGMITDAGDLEENVQAAMAAGGMDLINMSLASNAYSNPLITCGELGDYTASASVVDGVVRGSVGKPLIFVEAAGNERGSSDPCTGDGNGYGTISPPATAKNSIAVGSISTATDTVSSFSSLGPTDDGRLKPDLAAPGCHDESIFNDLMSTNDHGGYSGRCGTSQATPVVSGIAALMVEQWKADHENEVPANHTVKAVLVHGAKSKNNSSAPSYRAGYGKVDGQAAVDLIKDPSKATITRDQVDNSVTETYRFYSDGAAPPKVTLAWDDPSGPLNSSQALINDLDLRLIAPGETARQAPWTLNPSSPSSPAARLNNSRDNVEMVEGEQAKAGVWTVRVSGTRVAAGPQTYTLVTPPRRSLSTAEAAADEGNSGQKDLTFTVSLSEVANVDVTFDFTTESATATAGDDFAPSGGALTIPAGQRSVAFSVTVNGDTDEEPTEVFLVRLSNPTNAYLDKSFTHGHILDDDQPRDYDVMAATGPGGDTVPTATSIVSPLTGLGNAPSINDRGSVAFSGFWSSNGVEGVMKGTKAHTFTHLTYGFTSTSRKWGDAVQINDSDILVTRDRTSGSPQSNRIRVWDGKQPQGCATASTPCYAVVASGGTAEPGKSSPDFASVDTHPSISNAVTSIEPKLGIAPASEYGPAGSEDLARDFRNGVAFRAQRGGDWAVVATPQRQRAGSSARNPFNQNTVQNAAVRAMIAETGETVFRRTLPAWGPDLPARIGDVIVPTSFKFNGFKYEAVALGSLDNRTSAAGEPVWPTAESATVVDGGVTWKNTGTYPLKPGSSVEEPSIVLMEGDRSIAEPGVWHKTSAVSLIAGPDNGFTKLGRSPGISDDGQVVTFYGELSAVKATELGTTPGPGIFASVKVGNGSRKLARIAGVSGNGQLDPGETYVDTNLNGEFDSASETDTGKFASFDVDGRVVSNTTQATLRSVGITFMATSPSGETGLYVTRLRFVPREGDSFDHQNPDKLEVKGTRVVVKEGDRIKGLPGRVARPADGSVPSSIGIYDPINDRQEGDVAFWVHTVEESDGGTAVNRQAVIRAMAPKTPVLFIPGIAGSELYDRAQTFADQPMGEKIWLDPQFGYDEYLRTRLSLRPEHTAGTDIYAPDALRYVKIAGITVPGRNGKVYGPFLEALVAQGGYTEYDVPFDRPEYRTAAGCDLSQKPNRPDLFVFPYDWRLDNGLNAQRVAQYVACIQLLYPGTEINMLTHSMGGLLGRRYLLDNQDNPVHAMITVAAPWLGATKLPYVLETGDFAPPVATGPGVAYAAQSLTAAHQLSPSRAFFDLGGQPIGENGKDENGNGIDTELYTFDQFKQFEDLRYPFSTPGTTADDFHSHAVNGNAQDDWRLDSTGIVFHHLYGVQNTARTVGQILFEKTLACRLGIGDEQTCQRQFKLRVNKTLGDGTVPEISASRRSIRLDLNSPDATIYPFIGGGGSDDDDFDHNKMLHNLDIQRKVLDLLNAESPRTSSAASIATSDPREPATASGAGFREVELLNITGLHLADDLGNSTADIAPGFPGSVPGASTFVLSADARNVVFNDGGTYIATFQATGTPLTVALTTSDGTALQEAVRWRDLDLPAGRTVRLTLRADGTEELTWDSDGDPATAEVPIAETSSVSGSSAADNSGPAVSHSERAAGDQVEVTLEATDPAGVAAGSLRYSTDGTTYRSYTAPFTVDPDTVSLVTAYADDTLGNRSTVTEIPIEILNQPPTADALSVTTPEDSAGAGVTLSGSDPDGDAITFSVVTPPADGTLSGTGDVLTYTPAANFSGTDTFTYRAHDAGSNSEPATVTITVTPVNDAPRAAADTVTVAEDDTVLVDVLANDDAGPGESDQALRIETVGAAGGGTAVVEAGKIRYTPDLDRNGSDTFTYQACDDGTSGGPPVADPLCAAASVTVSITAVNDRPRGEPEQYATDEDSALGVAAPGLLANDSDVDRDAISAVAATQPANGSVTVGADGSFSYTPRPDYNGPDSFSYRVSDGSLQSDPIPVTVTVRPVPDAPVAADDQYDTAEDGVLAVVAPGVLAGDSDADGDALTATIGSGPSHGTLRLEADGAFEYRPNPDYSGPDSFTYRASDGALSSTATVTIEVGAVADAPVAVVDVAAIDEDTELVVPPRGVLANDTDADGDVLSAQLVSGTSNGTLSLSADGGWRYVPNRNFHGADSFSYRANDGALFSSPVEVKITVNAVADAPVAAGDSFTGVEDETLSVPKPGVLAGDTDVDGDSLTAILDVGPLHGTLTLNGDGSFLYTPTANYSGPDSFTYRASDGNLVSQPATVTLDVTPAPDRPVALDDSYATPAGTALTVEAPGVLSNDTDPDGDTLAASLVTGPEQGALTLGPDGSFTFTPPAGFEGIDSFTYRASDGTDSSLPATVRLRIGNPNTAPLGEADTFSLDEDVPLTVPAPGVLANDTDPEGDALTVTVATPPAHGTLALAADGSFTYTPPADFSGTDSFTYRINDGRADSTAVSVTLATRAVNDAPVATDDSASTAEDTPLIRGVPGVLANDRDVDSGDLSALLVRDAARGRLELRADGSFTYEPGADFSGTDSFTYRVSDGALQSEPVAVTIEVTPVNDAPVSHPDGAVTAEDTPATIPVPGVLANDVDVDSPTLSAVVVQRPAHGTLELNANGSFTYTPGPNFFGTDTFTYRASDGTDQSAPTTATMTVTPVNDLPVAGGDSYAGTEDVPLDVPAPGVLGNDADADGDVLTAVVEAGPGHGTLELRPDGSFSYVPSANYHGPDGFTYRVDDGSSRSAAVPVSLTVQAVPDSPLAGDDAYSTAEDTVLAVAAPGVLANDSDPDGDALEIEQLSAPAHGTVELRPDGSFTYRPANGYSGPDSFTYRLVGEPAGEPATVRLTVGPVADRPVLVDDGVELPEDGIAPVDVLANDVPGDPDEQLELVSSTAPNHGSATIEAGKLVFRPHADWHGTDGVTYTACHRGATPDSCATARLSIIVTPVNDIPVAGPDAFAVDEDGVLEAAAPGLLANDTDADGDGLVAAVVTQPANGTLTVGADGSLRYAPNPDFNGSDTFSYRPADGQEAGAPASVTITVRPVIDRPVPGDDRAATDEDVGVLLDVRANDAAGDAGRELVVVSVTAPSFGTATVEGQSVRYRPALDRNGVDRFTYTVCQQGDGPEGCATGTVEVTVNAVNDAPVAAGDSYSVDQDAVLDTPGPGVLANDADVDGPITAVLGTGPSHGNLTLQPNGSFRYVPGAGFNGTDSFTYRASDGAAASTATTVTIVVRAINSAPVAVADSYTTGQRNGIVEPAPGVLANDRDPDGNPLSVQLVRGPRRGTLTLRPDGSFSYIPEPDFAGADSFSYRVSDGTLSSGEAVVSILVEAAPAPAAPPPEVSAGYWLAGGDGGVFSYGDAPFFGSTGAMKLNQPVVGIVSTVSGNGYWLVASDGGIFAFGDAPFFGSTGAMKLNQPVVGMVPTPSGKGYWLVAKDGGIFAFGDAPFFGSTGAMRLNQPVVGMVSLPSGAGYWMVATDGGIFAFGDAAFFGSTGDIRLNRPIVAMVGRPTGQGYWMVATDGGIFAFGDAEFRGSTADRAITAPIISMAPTRSGSGYWLVGSDAAVYAFGDAGFFQGSGGTITPIAGATPNPSGTGLVLTDERGAAFTFGETEFRTDAPPLQLNSPIVGLALRP